MKHLSTPGVEIGSNCHGDSPPVSQISEMGNTKDILQDFRTPSTQVQGLPGSNLVRASWNSPVYQKNTVQVPLRFLENSLSGSAFVSAEKSHQTLQRNSLGGLYGGGPGFLMLGVCLYISS